MKYFTVAILFLLVGCVYAPTVTYAPSNSYTQTYAPVYAPTRPSAYVPIYSTRPVYGSQQNIQNTHRYYPVIVRRRFQ